MTISRCDVIHVVAGVAVDGDGRTLLVRKAGTNAFMQPGGKVIDGETAEQALAREIREEIGCGITAAPVSLGRFSAPAANEFGCSVDADLFAVELEGEVRPGAEIAEAVWHDPAGDTSRILAPLTRLHVLPIVRSMKGRSQASCG